MAECFDLSTSFDKELETLTDVQRPQDFFNFVNQSRNTGLYTDVTIVIGKEKFPAHRLILASLSDYFPPLLKDKNDSGEITLHNINPEAFAILLNYAYTGKVDITNGNVQDILITSDYLSVDYIKGLCIKFITVNSDSEKVCDMLVFALQHQIPELTKELLIYHLDDISQTEMFCQIDAKFLENFFSDENLILYDGGFREKALRSEEREKLILNSVLRYLSVVSVSHPEITEIMIRTVRLPHLLENTIQKCLENFKSLENNEIIEKHIMLRKVALKYFQGTKIDSFVIKSVHPETQEIPDAWFKERIYGVVSFRVGSRRYASNAEIQPSPYPPKALFSDRNIQIRRIEIWLRIWENKVLIGGIKLFYRSTLKNVDASLVYQRGHCPEGKVNHVVELEPDEVIVKVVVGSGFLIDRLGFETNKGRVLGPFGGPGGREAVEHAPPGALSYLVDINCDTVHTEGADAIFNLLLRWIHFS